MFYLIMVIWHQPLHGLLFLISSKGSFICTIPQTDEHRSWSTGWIEKYLIESTMKDRSLHPLDHETYHGLCNTPVVEHWLEQEIGSTHCAINGCSTMELRLAPHWDRKEMFYLTTHSTHFSYGYMASDMVNDCSDSERKPAAATWATLFD